MISRTVIVAFAAAIAYEMGEGVPRDQTQAARWFRKAADQGNAMAQSGLGKAYATGEGVPRGPSRPSGHRSCRARSNYRSCIGSRPRQAGWLRGSHPSVLPAWRQSLYQQPSLVGPLIRADFGARCGVDHVQLIGRNPGSEFREGSRNFFPGSGPRSCCCLRAATGWCSSPSAVWPASASTFI
jgi:hypothetical protein